MPDLCLGEEETPYEYDPKKTAATVAAALEERYGLFSAFAEAKEEEIGEILADEMEAVLSHLLETGEETSLGSIGRGVEELFRDFIDTREAEIYVTDAPTAAALKGYKTLRRPHEGPRRASFDDTSLLKNSFRAWIEE